MRPRFLRNRRKLNAGSGIRPADLAPAWGRRQGPRNRFRRSVKMTLKQIIIGATSSVLIACAGSQGTASEAGSDVVTGRPDCISTRTIRDYRVLDDANLVVTAEGSRKYHISHSRRAAGLRASWKIGFRSTSGRVCGGFDEIVVDQGLGPERIRIAGITELTPEEYDALLARFGKGEPVTEPAPARKNVESAEVEELD